jgi:gluconolactonase
MPLTITDDCAPPHHQTAAIVRIDLSKMPKDVTSSGTTAAVERLTDLVDLYEDLPAGLAMPNGATKWTIDGQECILWCEQGRHSRIDSRPHGKDVHSALVAFNPRSLDGPSSASTSILLDHYKGKRFSSLNDVVVHEQSGVVFFADPDYGVGQNFKRARPTEEEEYAPNALYACYPPTGEVRLIDGRYDKRE